MSIRRVVTPSEATVGAAALVQLLIVRSRVTVSHPDVVTIV